MMHKTRVLGSCRIEPRLKPTWPETFHLQEAKRHLYHDSLLESVFPLLQSSLTRARPIPLS